MPVVYRCSRCKNVIYVFARAGQDYYGIPTPSELAARLSGVCPYCGKALSMNIDVSKVVIKAR